MLEVVRTASLLGWSSQFPRESLPTPLWIPPPALQHAVTLHSPTGSLFSAVCERVLAIAVDANLCKFGQNNHTADVERVG